MRLSDKPSEAMAEQPKSKEPKSFCELLQHVTGDGCQRVSTAPATPFGISPLAFQDLTWAPSRKTNSIAIVMHLDC